MLIYRDAYGIIYAYIIHLSTFNSINDFKFRNNGRHLRDFNNVIVHWILRIRPNFPFKNLHFMNILQINSSENGPK